MANTKIPAELSSTPSISDSGDATAITITSAENVGIGTASPFSTAKLQVKTATNINVAVQTGTTEGTGIKINAFNDAGDTNIPLELNGSVLLLKTGEAERLRVDSSGNVGTQARLSVGTTTVGGGNTKIVATGGTDNYIQLVSNTGTGGVSLGNAGSVFLLYTHTGALGSESFSERLRIDSNGHLIVGTTSEYSGTSGNITAYRQIDIGANDANLKTLFFHRNAGEGEIGGIAAGVTGFSTMGRIDFVAEGVAGGSQASSIRFKTTDSATEALQWQITQYGTFMPNGNNTKNIGSTSNRISVLYTANAVNVSDQTLKTEIQDCDLGLAFINTLKPKSYKHLKEKNVPLDEGHDDYNKKHYGLLAQDLIDGSLSDSVYGTKDGEYSLAYNDLIAPMIKAIQELKEENDSLKSRIETLEG